MAFQLFLPEGDFPVKFVLEILGLAKDFGVNVLLALFLDLRFPLARLKGQLVADLGFLAFPFVLEIGLFLAVLGFQQLLFIDEILLPELLLRFQLLFDLADFGFGLRPLLGQGLLVLIR